MGWWGALGHGGIIHRRAHQPAALLLNPGFSGFTLLVEQMENAAIKLVSAYLIYCPRCSLLARQQIWSLHACVFLWFVCFVCNWEKMFRNVEIRGTLPRLLFENENNQRMVEWKLDIYHLKFFCRKRLENSNIVDAGNSDVHRCSFPMSSKYLSGLCQPAVQFVSFIILIFSHTYFVPVRVDPNLRVFFKTGIPANRLSKHRNIYCA